MDNDQGTKEEVVAWIRQIHGRVQADFAAQGVHPDNLLRNPKAQKLLKKQMGDALALGATAPATAIVNLAEGILNPVEDIELPHLSASFVGDVLWQTLGNQDTHIWDLRPEIEPLSPKP
ncbi:uncharacterized protein N7515_000152 [Penicillium bovifimosum]|uniref:Uncharacterized protein n=1 Tax=Penicillium bovifimosum TaxID=126998 RepID=A0A9W9HF75_9EURO|nr:uncharacterized protein N7515_000152 [Penicillium bovifimosum]KAJ5145588.1 hypothetical protein N7515_000152 [Penicillium bovifimosum]